MLFSFPWFLFKIKAIAALKNKIMLFCFNQNINPDEWRSAFQLS